MKLDTYEIQLIRARSELTTKQIADRYPCSVSRINALLKRSNVRPETAGKIARALGVDITAIIRTEE